MAGAPAWGTGSANAGVQSSMGTAVGQLAPLATQWNGPQQDIAQYVAPSQSYAKAAGPSWVSAFASKVGAITSETGHLAEGAGNWLLNQGKTAIEAPVKFEVNGWKLEDDAFKTYEYRQKTDAQTASLQKLNADFKLGRINHSQYSEGLKQWTKDNEAVQQQFKGLTAQIGQAGKQTTQAVINTTSSVVAIMTGGGTAVADIGAKEAATFLGSDVAKSVMLSAEDLLNKMATNAKLMDMISTTGGNAVKDSLYSVLFNGAKTQTAAGLSRAAAANLLFKYPLTFNMLSGTGNQVYKELQNEKYGDAVKTIAFNSALLLSGGPIGQALKYGGKTLSALSEATFGESSFIDTFAQATGKDAQKLMDAIQTGGESYVRNWRAFEATNLGAEKGNITSAVYRIVDAWKAAGRPIDQMTEKDMIEEMNNWANIQGTIHDTLIQKGMSEEDASRVVVGRWTALDKQNIATELSKYSDRNDRLQAWENYKAQNPHASYSNNKSLDDEIKNIINTSRSAKSTGDAINRIEASFNVGGRAGAYLKGLKSQIEKMGLIAIEPFNLEAPFKEGEGPIKSKLVGKAANADFFTRATDPIPVLGHLGSVLTSMGLSPVAATQRVQDLFTHALAGVLSEKNLLGAQTDEDSDKVLKTLGNYMKDVKSNQIAGRKVQYITDYRQLTLKDITQALGVTKEEAKGVRSALTEAMLRVPIEVRGAGDRVMDWNYKFNPAAKWFTKIQSATRFAWNPIFQARVSFKYEILAQLKTQGKPVTLLGTNWGLSHIFPEYYNQLDSIDRLLQKNGVYDAGLAAEAADENAIRYHTTANTLYGSQRRTISSLVATMAARAEMSVEDFVKAFPGETRDAVRTITEYNPKANFLNSPLTRTLNYAFFPFRFNVKVATAIATTMAKQPAVVQFAIIKGMMNAHQYLNSPEGQAWYSKNSDVIQLAEYFTPLETVSSVAKMLNAPGQLMSYGELGGLPFGWISGLLQSEGLISSQPYVSPTTGQTLPNYIPADTRGRFAAAIEDLIGVLYTYPGSSLGLTSKTKIDENVANWFVPGHSTKDFNVVTPTNLTAQQQSFQQVVQQAKQSKANVQQSLNQAPPEAPSTQVPQQDTGITTGPGNKAGGTTTKKKKGQFIPQLLPGQTQLGQIP